MIGAGHGVHHGLPPAFRAMLKPAWRGMKTFAAMLREASGSVVLTSSVHAVIGLPGHAAYAAAKGALGSLGRQLAVEYGPDLRANTVLPGPVLPPRGTGSRSPTGRAVRRPRRRSGSGSRRRWPPP